MNREKAGSWLDGHLDGEWEHTDSSIWKLISPPVPGVEAQQAKGSISVLFSK
jgi:hypothetical protein